MKSMSAIFLRSHAFAGGFNVCDSQIRIAQVGAIHASAATKNFPSSPLNPAFA
jgi:hypothetical protein